MKKRAWFGGLFFAIVLVAGLGVGARGTDGFRSRQDRAEAKSLTTKMKAICVGRYLIDVPIQARVGLPPARMAGFEVDTRKESGAAFRQRIAAREADIRTDPGYPSGQDGMEEARDISMSGMVGRTFVFGRRRNYLMDGERRVDIESVSIEAHAHMQGVSVMLSGNGQSAARANVAQALLGQFRPRRDDENPGMSGFCVDHGIFLEPLPPHKTEHFTMRIGFPAHPDARMLFESMPGGDGGPGLLARTTAADAEAGGAPWVTKLRQGKRGINGVAGEEVLEKAREQNARTSYAFNWEAQGALDDPLQPYLSLELQTGAGERPGGQPVDSSLSEDTILALWDAISSSIRPRRNQPPRRP